MGWGGCTSDDAGAPEVNRVYGDYGHLLFQGLESNVCMQNVSTPTPSLSGGGVGRGGLRDAAGILKLKQTWRKPGKHTVTHMEFLASFRMPELSPCSDEETINQGSRVCICTVL